ncbi:MAG: hypothetical protein AB7H77_09875 [Bdellovibrionales bacterium]
MGNIDIIDASGFLGSTPGNSSPLKSVNGTRRPRVIPLSAITSAAAIYGLFYGQKAGDPEGPGRYSVVPMPGQPHPAQANGQPSIHTIQRPCYPIEEIVSFAASVFDGRRPLEPSAATAISRSVSAMALRMTDVIQNPSSPSRYYPKASWHGDYDPRAEWRFIKEFYGLANDLGPPDTHDHRDLRHGLDTLATALNAGPPQPPRPLAHAPRQRPGLARLTG